MRFFTAAALLASLASFVVAQKPNPISAPTAGDQVEAGKPVTIKWNPTGTGKITLKLRKGDADNLDTVTTIVADVANSGEYTWTPDEDLKAGEDYTIEISSEEGENYSPRFNLESDGAGVTPTGSSTITKTSTSVSTTATEDVETTETASTATETEEPTTTTSTRRPTATADEEEEEEEEDVVPDADSAAIKATSPLALVFCVAMAVAYLN